MTHSLLLVDDGTESLAGLERGLSASGYNVLTAVDGPAAMSLVDSGAANLVIIGSRLGAQDAFVWIEQIKARACPPPVIVLVRPKVREDEIRCVVSGVDDWVTAPATVRELAGRARLLLGEEGDRAPQPQAPAPVDLDAWLEPGAGVPGPPEQELEREEERPRRRRRPVDPRSRRIVTAALVGSLAILVVGGVRSVHVARERAAEEARGLAILETLQRSEGSMAPGERAATEPAATAPEKEGEMPPAPSSADMPTHGDPAIENAALEAPPAPGAARAAPDRTSPTVATGPTGETPIELHRAGVGSLVSQATQALAHGSNARAFDLARSAIAANPADADGWLALAAVYEVTGNGGGAHGAYAGCVAQAKSMNVSECRLLARR